MSSGARLALALLALLSAASLGPTGAAARTLEVPVFLSPGRNPNQSPSTAPGARPFEVLNEFAVNQSPANGGEVGPAENIRDLRFELPAGLLAAAARYPRCSAEAFAQSSCATVTQVGVAKPEFSAGAPSQLVPVFNVAPPSGRVAQFAFRAAGAPVHIEFELRNGGDYGATGTLRGLSQVAGLVGSSLHIWGVPGDPGHDAERFDGVGVPVPGPYPEAPPFQPLISNPTSCRGPLVTTMEVSTWQHPEQSISAAPFEAPGTNSCDQLEFDPEFSAKPTTNLADSPSGLDVHLRIPQIQDPNGSAAAGLRDARVDLPAGLTINPAGASGLSSCTPAQIGLAGVASERQLLRYDMPPVSFSGTFTVSREGATTIPIASTATQAQVRSALEGLPELAGNIEVSGAAGGWIVTFVGALAGTDVPLLTGAVTDNSSEMIAVTATGGTYKLESGGVSTTALPFNASAAEVQSALRQIPALGLGNLYPGNVFVGDPSLDKDTRTYSVFFANDLNGAKPELVADPSLSGPAAGVTITPTDPPSPHGLSVATFGAEVPGTPQFNSAPAACPDASQIGTVRIDSPAQLDHPLFGSVYLATPGQNPYGSLIAIYMTLTDTSSGINVKLPARIDPDPASGRLRVSIAEAPQLPFEDLDLELFKGTAAPLRTPSVCTTYTVETQLTPTSAPEGAPRRPKDSFTIANGAGAGACPKDSASVPDSTHFSAGTADPSAGIYSPFVLRLTRPDGSLPLRDIDTTLPEGLLARVAGVPLCPEGALVAAVANSGAAELRSPSCPAASRIGAVATAAGAGPAPENLIGSAYLAGPYRGAPLSLALVTPALAGPFDLGTVVLRVALHVDPQTTRVTATSDPFPASLGGVPLDLRSVALNLDPGFAKNPTSCYPLEFSGPQSARFQIGDCRKLAFKPKLELALKGSTERGAHPALSATLTNSAKRTAANIAGLDLNLPRSLRFDKAHLGAAGTVYGQATVTTPLLDQPLHGPLTVRRSGIATQLIVDLHGQTDLVLAGRPAGKQSRCDAGQLRFAARRAADQVHPGDGRRQEGTLQGISQPLRSVQPRHRRAHRPERSHLRSRRPDRDILFQGRAVKRALCIGLVLAAVGITAPAALAAGPPIVVGSWPSGVGSEVATMRADINPNGSATTYLFEYTTEAKFRAEGFFGATRIPQTGVSIGTGSVSQRLDELTPDTGYRFRVIATNSAGVTPILKTRSFRTDRLEPIFALPDDRGWEIVSPFDKNGGDIQGVGANHGGGVLQAAAQGGSITYTSASSFANPLGSPGPNQYLSTRGSDSWSTENVTLPMLSGTYPESPASGVPYQLFSGDLQNALISNGRRCRVSTQTQCPVENAPLSGSGAPAGYRNYYLRFGPGSFEALLTQLPNLDASHFEMAFAGATPDLAHVVLSSCAAIGPGVVEVPGSDGECDPTKQNLYEVSGAQMRLINPTPGGALVAQSRAISADGSRVYWTDGAALYLSSPSSNTKVADGGTFQTASLDGSLAFYTAAGHLYRYTATSGASTDLTPSGGVTGVVGASEDGGFVYYLTAAGLFLSRNGAPSSTLVAEQAEPSSAPPSTGNARLSADGRRLLFVSTAELTAYDNRNINTDAPEPEVYLYTAPGTAGAGVTCVSCNPSGERPIGAAEIPGASPNGVGALAPDVYKPRVLSGDAKRVFFESFDSLAVSDTNGDLDVYQWEANGTGQCVRPTGCIDLISSGRSEGGAGFIDASADGSDAFFLTDGSLVSADTGGVDVYDARIGGGFPGSTDAIPCFGDACQVLPSAPQGAELNSVHSKQSGNAEQVKFKPLHCKKNQIKRLGRCVKKKSHKKKGGSKR